MGRLIEMLLREPLVLLLILGAIGQLIGQVTKAAKKQQQRQRDRQATTTEPMPSQRRARPVRAQPTAEQVAAEMRRILGMEGARPQSRPAQRPAAHAVEQMRGDRGREEAASGDRAPEPLRPTRLGQLDVHVDPHVGQQMRERRAPQSGSVGKTDLGQLGGRAALRSVRTRRTSHLVDLGNLPRAMVLREILDRPLALRDLDGPR